jgi:hypothetical protein
MPAMTATIGADANGMDMEFQAAAQMARRTGAAIQDGLAGGGAMARGGSFGQTVAMREILVLMREMSRGNWTRVPGSLSILLGQFGLLKLLFKDGAMAAQVMAEGLTQVANVSAGAAVAAQAVVAANMQATASMGTMTAGEILAMKADSDRAAMAVVAANADRAKAVAATQAADAMMAQSGAARFSVGPIGWVALALIAAGTAAYFLARHFRTLAAEEKNLANLMDTTTRKFVDQAEGMKEAANETERHRDRLDDLAEAQEGLAAKTETALKAMREQAKLERELAQAKGASKQTLAEMDIAAARKELALVETAKLQLNRKIEEDKDAETAASNELAAFDADNNLTGVSQAAAKAAAIVDEIRAAMKNKPTTFTGEYTQAFPGAPWQSVSRPTTKDDKFPVKGMPDMSLNQALKMYQDFNEEEQDLLQTKKALEDIEKKGEKRTDKDIQDQKALSDRAQELTDDLKAKADLLPQIAEAENKGRMAHGTVNALQTAGAFTSPAVQVDLARTANRLLHQIVLNTGRDGHGAGGGGF